MPVAQVGLDSAGTVWHDNVEVAWGGTRGGAVQQLALQQVRMTRQVQLSENLGHRRDQMTLLCEWHHLHRFWAMIHGVEGGVYLPEGALPQHEGVLIFQLQALLHLLPVWEALQPCSGVCSKHRRAGWGNN